MFLYNATLFLIVKFNFEYNQAALLFKEAGEKQNGDRELPGNCFGEWMPFRFQRQQSVSIVVVILTDIYPMINIFVKDWLLLRI